MSACMTTVRTLSILIKSGHALDFERVLASNYEKLIAPGDVVVDIGAHTGKHFDRFVSLVGDTGKALAFEPLTECAGFLQGRYGDRSNVKIHNLALSNFRGTAEFISVTNSPEESGLREKIYNDPDRILNKTTVSVDTLDVMLSEEPRINFIKIDVEGAEISLLEGARACLARTRPFVSVEYGFPSYSAYGNTKSTLFDAAKSMQYVCADLYGNIIGNVEDWEKVCDAVYWDYILVPDERVNEFAQRVAGI